jgi:hypothetical protein
LGTGVVFSPDTSTDPESATSGGPTVVTAPGAIVHAVDSVAFAASVLAADSASYFLTAPQQAAIGESGQLVRVLGDTTIAGGTFDGILIVGGRLTITGPFVAAGLIVARGPIEAITGGFALTGAIMSYAPKNSSTPTIKFSGVTIRYSVCVVDRALRRSLIPRLVALRSWAELF